MEVLPFACQIKDNKVHDVASFGFKLLPRFSYCAPVLCQSTSEFDFAYYATVCQPINNCLHTPFFTSTGLNPNITFVRSTCACHLRDALQGIGLQVEYVYETVYEVDKR